MPMIDVTVPSGALEPAAAQRLTEELATVLLRWEGAPDTEFFRAITWVYWHELAQEQLAVGGRPGQVPRFRIEVTVPEGALSQRRKEGLVADVHTAVMAATGLDERNALHVWTLIHEITEGNWGAAGQTTRFEDLKKLSQAESDAATS